MNKNKTDASSKLPTAVTHGQIAYLFRHGSIWLWGNLFAASLFVLLRWVEGEPDMLLLLIWYTAVIAIGIDRKSVV
jgi:hypothetical protein